MIIFLIYLALGYWATGRTIYADKILIGTENGIFGRRLCMGFLFGVKSWRAGKACQDIFYMCWDFSGWWQAVFIWSVLSIRFWSYSSKISLYCKKMSGKYWKSVFLRVHMYPHNIQIVRIYVKTIYKDR